MHPFSATTVSTTCTTCIHYAPLQCIAGIGQGLLVSEEGEQQFQTSGHDKVDLKLCTLRVSEIHCRHQHGVGNLREGGGESGREREGGRGGEGKRGRERGGEWEGKRERERGGESEGKRERVRELMVCSSYFVECTVPCRYKVQIKHTCICVHVFRVCRKRI